MSNKHLFSGKRLDNGKEIIGYYFVHNHKSIIAPIQEYEKILHEVDSETVINLDAEKLRSEIKLTLSGLEYASFNLVDDETKKNFDKKQAKNIRTIESTCPEITLLIELRDLKEAIGNE